MPEPFASIRLQVSPLLDWHRQHGARLSPAPIPEVALAFSSVPAEYAAARESTALFDHSQQSSLRVLGPAAADFLQRLLANDVRRLEPGRSQANLLLTPKGKVLEHFELRRLSPEAFLLHLGAGRSEVLHAALDRYLFADQVQLSDATAETAALDLCGPEAAAVLARALEAPVDLGWRAFRSYGAGPDATVELEHLPVAGSAGWRLHVPPAQALTYWTRLLAAGATPAGHVAYESLRVEAGAARYGVDVGLDIYPQEARLEDAFSLSKGCYVGQEVVAKIDTYGGLNKRLVGLRLPNDSPLAAGTRLWHLEDGEWRDVGQVTSWAYSFALDTGLALGYVKKQRQAPQTLLRIGDGPEFATIVLLPVRADALPVSGADEPKGATPPL